MGAQITITANNVDPGVNVTKLAESIKQVLDSAGFNAKINMNVNGVSSGIIGEKERETMASGYKIASPFEDRE